MSEYVEIRLETLNEIVSALRLFLKFDCPQCNADCSGSNIPSLPGCPMRLASDAIAKAVYRTGGVPS